MILMHWCFAWNLQLYHLTPMGISGVGYPGQRGKLYVDRSCVIKPSFKHRSLHSHFDTYEGLVTVDDTIASSGVFNIVMTNKSNRHIKIVSGQTMGMLHSCEDT